MRAASGVAGDACWSYLMMELSPKGCPSENKILSASIENLAIFSEQFIFGATSNLDLASKLDEFLTKISNVIYLFSVELLHVDVSLALELLKDSSPAIAAAAA